LGRAYRLFSESLVYEKRVNAEKREDDERREEHNIWRYENMRDLCLSCY
jgi:hypothetical protein